MTVATGTRLGPYEVVALIGAGGMGEVYRAHDTRLNRDVALKVLPEAFSRDTQRMARFEREAKLLASLNHPNIAAIYGIEESGPIRALVMELVEGPNLSERIRGGPVPVDEALPIARQVADAVEYAHENNVIHRDLKPANIKVKADGMVKVLDFGLAKAMSDDPTEGDMSNSPTLSMAATMQGVILGTAAYMAPEQAKGKRVDRRADVWAFGVVLYEMLVGKQLYEGETIPETLASVMKEAPALENLPADTPPAIRNLLRRCLEKNVKRRLQHAGEARIIIEDVISGVAPAEAEAAPTARGHRLFGRMAAGAAAVLLLALAGLSFVHFREVPPDERVLRLSVRLPEDSLVPFFALSPDGRRLVIGGNFGDRTNVAQLWLRALDSPELQPLAGTDAARTPFWSPDGRYIGFFAEGKLKTVLATGGPAQALCDSGLGGGGAWNRDGVILFSPGGGPLQRVTAAGGDCAAVTKPEEGSSHRLPVFLPDGNHFFYVVTGGDAAKRGIYLASLDNPDGRRLLADQSSVVFVPPASGSENSHILFLREETLMAQPFDGRALQLVGEVFPVVDQASMTFTTSQVAASASDNGILVYLAGAGRNHQYTWFDRSGKELGKVGSVGTQRSVVLSPDDKFAAIPRGAASGLWLRELNRDLETRFTFSPITGNSPVWSPDGSRVVFSSGADLYRKDAHGGAQEEALLSNANRKRASDWSRDGRFLLYTEEDQGNRGDLWILPDPLGKPGDSKPYPFLQTEFVESQGQFSLDGRWIAYTSTESGREEVYVRPFAGGPSSPSGKWLVSSDGGNEPRWRRDGKELFYLGRSGNGRRVMAVPIQTGPSSVFESGAPAPLFVFPVIAIVPQSNSFAYGVAADGERFLANVLADSGSPTLNVVVNWQKAVAQGE